MADYLKDYDAVLSAMRELSGTPFAPVEVILSRPSGREHPSTNSFSTAAGFDALTPVGCVAVIDGRAYQKTDRTRWRCLWGDCRGTRLSLDLVASVLSSATNHLVVVNTKHTSTDSSKETAE